MIYYDYDPSLPGDVDGRISANALRNLLGHFKTFVTATNVSSYTAGQLGKYDAVFYIGSTFSPVNIPDAFENDVIASTNPVVWVGYNLWELPGFVSPDTNRFGIHYEWGDSQMPGYDTVTYKGEWLYKSGSITRISVSNFVQILATATSRVSSVQAVPYAVRSSNFWYFADNPFRSQLLADRSLVIADLLHEILGSVTNAPRRALARIDDIEPALTSRTSVSLVSAALRDLGVSGHFGIIPRYRDPLGTYTNSYPADLRMSENRAFLRTLTGVLRDGGEFVDHGYTHESGDAESGSGYEFWDTARTNTLPYDSWAWCNGRVTNALNELLTCGFPVTCWETPHYEASLLDYTVFPETYRWSHERLRNYGFFVEGLSTAQVQAVSMSNNYYVSQWFPYTIYQSCYGSAFLPENIDRYSTNATDPNGLHLTISNKIEYARKMSVVRDAVAAFYYHPQYGVTNLTNIVQQMRGLGYAFASPRDLVREDPVATHTNSAWADTGTARVFMSATNLIADMVVGNYDNSDNNRVDIEASNATVWVEQGLTIGSDGSSNTVCVATGGVLRCGFVTIRRRS